MASLGPSDTESETSVHTEPSAGDAYRDAYAPYRVGTGNPRVQAFRRWWLANPLNNLWAKKPSLWRTFQAEQAGASPEDAVRSGANVKLEDLATERPSLRELADDPEYSLTALPSDEAWFGEPDPALYAPGTNDLSKEQLAAEVAKGNVATLRQLRQHLESATDAELGLWAKVFAAQEMKDNMFVDTPSGRVALWDLLTYVQANPELAQLAARDINLAVPAEGMTREERIKVLAEVAPWRLCGNERQMVLPDEVAARLPWGLLAGSTWWSRRPSRWLKGLDGVRDFYFGLYAHEAAAQQLLGPQWGGRDPQGVLAQRAFYREAVGLAPSLGMTLLAVASRPLPLRELTQEWEQRVRQQIDKHGAAAAGSSSSQPKMLFSTSSGSYATASESEDGSSGSGSSSSEEAVAAAAYAAAAARAAAAPPAQAQRVAAVTAPPPPPAQAPKAAQQQQQQQQPQQQQPVLPAAAAAVAAPPPPPPPPSQQQQQVVAVKQPLRPPPPAQPSSSPSPAAAAAAPPVVAPVKEVVPSQYASLAQLVRLFDPQTLAEHTELLDMRGTRLREGATIILTAHPSGALLVQAVSPGLVKEQKSYLLGSVADPALARAVMSLFLDPDTSLDAAFAAEAGATLLAFANGYRSGQLEREAAERARRRPLGFTLEEGRQLLRRGKWRLPSVGAAPEQQPLVRDVRRAVVYQQITAAFDSALRAAAAVQPGSGEDTQDVSVQQRVLSARRSAAEQELKRQLTALGMDASQLSLSDVTTASGQQPLPQDLLSLARPLAS